MNSAAEKPCLAQLAVLEDNREPMCLNRSHLPASIGRAKNCRLQLEAKGVWDNHVEVALKGEEFVLRPISEASTLVNDEPLKGTRRLANGDVIVVGSQRVQFRLGNVRQKRLGALEVFCWLALGAFVAAQACLIRWLG